MKALPILTAVLLLAGAAPAYYHFVHFGSAAPYRALYERFDVNLLPNSTLTYYIDDAAGRIQLPAGDSFAALVSQIRLAAKVWNDVDSSALRLAFGGLQSGPQQSGPAMEVLFEEVPPGIIAMGGPTVRADSNGAFVPILRSTVIVQPDLRNRASWSEAIFGTLVHEIGHSIGLQHTFTSGVMSTGVTRSTSKARPLSADDIAGISVLYPRPGSAPTTGTISGRVQYENGGPAALASVVAISPNGAAISTLTNPDGTYRIEALPSRNYYVYVHPLPPPREGQTSPGDIVFPVDPDGRPMPNTPAFETVFFSGSGAGVKDPNAASQLAVFPGTALENVNFFVRQRSGSGIHSVETYAYPGNVAVKPPYLSPGMLRPFFIATGAGLVERNAPAAGLTATVLGGASLLVRPYSVAPVSWIQMDLNSQSLLIPSDSARHVVFSANNDIYVLPSGFFHVTRQPPQISSISALDGAPPHTLVVTGTNFSPETRLLFDGAAGRIRSYEEGPGGSRIVVTAPAAPPGHQAAVTAVNADGQSSLFVQGEAPPTYLYPVEAPQPQVLALTPSFLPSGVEATVQIDVANMQFGEEPVAVGFGNSGISAKRVWVVSPGRLLVNVVVSPSAQAGTLTLTLASGLQVVTQPFALFLQGPSSRTFWLASSFANAATGQPIANPGSLVNLLAGGVPAGMNLAGATVLIGEQRLTPASVNGNLITVPLPANTPLGPLTLRLDVNGERSLPITIPVELPPIRILTASLTSIQSSRAVLLEVSNIGEGATSLSVTANGSAVRILEAARDGGRFRIVAELPPDALRSGALVITVSSDSRTSDPFSLTIGG